MQGERIASLDVARGFAIFVMIEAHIATILSSSILNDLSRVVAGPFFILISGLAFELFIKSRIGQGSSRSRVFLESLSRSIVLSAITFIPYAVASITMPSEFPWYGILKWSVFQVISVGYVLGFFLQRRLTLKLAAVATVLLCTLIFEDSEAMTFLTDGVFPLLPFLGFFIMGQILSSLYAERRIASMRTRNLVLLSILPTIVLVLVLLLSHTAFEKDNRGQVHVFFLICALQLATIVLFILIADRGKHKLELRALEGIGRISFSAYYFHLAILFALGEAFASIHFAPSDQLTVLITNMAILASVTWAISFIERRWSKYRYALGVEWMFRMSSKILVGLLSALARDKTSHRA